MPLAALMQEGLLKQCGCLPNPWSYSECAGFPTLETDSATAANYADRVGAPRGTDTSTSCSARSLCIACIMCHRLPYFADKPGDCGTVQPATISAGTKLTALGVMGLSAVTGGLTSLVSVPFQLTAQHTAAVAQEITVLCGVSQTYNSNAAGIESALSSGQITLQQAIAFANQLATQCIGAMASGLNDCNARCYYTYAVKALTLWCTEIFYPRLAAAYQQATTPSLLGIFAPPQAAPTPSTATIPAVAYSTTIPAGPTALATPLTAAPNPTGTPIFGSSSGGTLGLLGVIVAGAGLLTGHLLLAAAGGAIFLFNNFNAGLNSANQ